MDHSTFIAHRYTRMPRQGNQQSSQSRNYLRKVRADRAETFCEKSWSTRGKRLLPSAPDARMYVALHYMSLSTPSEEEKRQLRAWEDELRDPKNFLE